MRLLLFITFLLLCTTTFSQKRMSAKEFSNQIKGSMSRLSSMNNYRVSFAYVYKNGSPYGRNAYVTYDNFYNKYKVSFIKEDGSQTGCTLTDGNFIYSDYWKFKYNGNVYRLVNNYVY